MLLKEFPDLSLISLNDIISFSQESFFNLIQLFMVINSHIKELLTHGFDKIIDIIVLFFQSFDVFLILELQLINKLSDQIIFLRNNLLASFFLYLDILY